MTNLVIVDLLRWLQAEDGGECVRLVRNHIIVRENGDQRSLGVGCTGPNLESESSSNLLRSIASPVALNRPDSVHSRPSIVRIVLLDAIDGRHQRILVISERRDLLDPRQRLQSRVYLERICGHHYKG